MAILWISALASDSAAQMLSAKTIAQRGDHAPGFEKEGLFFEDFGFPSMFGAEPEPTPRIDRQGNVAFIGILGDDGIPNPPPALVPAVYKYVNGSLKLVARPGDRAPGTNSTFIGFPGPPAFPLEREALISQGGVALHATTQDAQQSLGLWSDRFGTLERIIRVGDVMPAPHFMSVHSFSTAFMDDGVIVINAAVNSNATDGLWRNRNGFFEVIATEGIPAPGTGPDIFFGEGSDGAFFGAIDGWGLNAAGTVVFQGYLKGPLAVCGNGICEAFIWPYQGENCQTCPQDCAGVQTGNPANRFCCGNGGGENPVGCEDPRCNQGGYVCDPPPPTIHIMNDEGIWVEDSQGNLHLVVREGDLAPQAGANIFFGSGGNGENGGFRTFSPDTTFSPRINDNGALLFGGRITSPDYYVKTSIWTTRSGAFELIATAASGLDGPAFPGDPAPGLEHHHATIADFLQADQSNDGRIAFRAVAIFENQPLTGTIGIWSDIAGELSLIAALGEPVPGIPGAVFEENMFMAAHVYADWDWLLFGAWYTGIGIDQSLPLFRVTADGEVELVLRPGFQIRLNSGTSLGDEVKTIASYTLGGFHSDAGGYVFEMTFTDGVHGVYVVDLIPPFAVPGDITGDGVVNVSDLIAVINAWGACSAPPTPCTADIAPQPSGDGQVNVSDLLMVINNWG